MNRIAAALLVLSAFCVPAAVAGESVRADVQKALGAKTAPLRASALETALAQADSAEAAQAIADLVLARDDGQLVVDAAIHALGRMMSADAVLVMRKEAESGAMTRRLRAIEALGRSHAPGSTAALAALLRADDAPIRAAAGTALGVKCDDTSVEDLATALADTAWTVRSAAAWALGRTAAKRSVPALCAALRNADGRLVDDLAVALAAVTGERFGPDPARYERWWAGQTKGTPATGAAWTAPPRAFDSPILGTRSRRILFVLETSETMKDAVNAASTDEEIAAAVAAAGKDLAADLKVAKTKLDVARVQLRVMLRSLKDGVQFDVCVYSGSPSFAFGHLTPADAASRKAAEARIASLSPGGPGNLQRALLHVFDPRGKDPFTAEEGPDAVVLLTDGALAEPGSKDMGEVGSAFTRWEAVRQVKFLVVAAGQHEDTLLSRFSDGPPSGAYVGVP